MVLMLCKGGKTQIHQLFCLGKQFLSLFFRGTVEIIPLLLRVSGARVNTQHQSPEKFNTRFFRMELVLSPMFYHFRFQSLLFNIFLWLKMHFLISLAVFKHHALDCSFLKKPVAQRLWDLVCMLTAPLLNSVETEAKQFPCTVFW